MFPKILDSTFPIASEEPGPGAFRCPGSPPPTTPPPPRNRNGASQSRGRPRGLRGSRLLWAEARARRSLGHHPPHNLIPPGAAAAGALSLRRESRRPAEARPGPELPFPPQAPRERRRGSRSSAFSWLRRGRLRPFGPVPGPRAPRSPPTQATREAARLRRPVRSWILAGTRCAACGDTEREKGVTAGPPEESGGRGGPPRQLSPGGYLQPPPRARAPSGLHSLLPVLPLPPPEKAPRKPPHFPSRLRRRNRGSPTVRARATSVRRAARAPSVGAPRAEGGATAARRSRRCGQPPPPRTSDSD